MQGPAPIWEPRYPPTIADHTKDVDEVRHYDSASFLEVGAQYEPGYQELSLLAGNLSFFFVFVYLKQG